MRKIIVISIILISVIASFFYFYGIVKVNDDYVLYSKNKDLKINDKVIVKNPFRDSLQISTIVGLAGDTVELRDAVLFVNGKKITNDSTRIKYRVICFTDSSEQVLIDRYKQDANPLKVYYINITEDEASELLENKGFLLKKDIIPHNFGQKNIYPFSFRYQWNKDNFGPLLIPYKGLQLEATKENRSLYRTTIQLFENQSDNKSIVFTKNYFFVLNDKRIDTKDSREWGAIAENQIKGKIISVF